MTIVTTPTTPRSRRDLVTNAAYEDVLEEVEELIRLETVRLAKESQSSELGKIHFQSGVVEGSKRVMARLKNYRSSALEDFRKDGKTTPDLFADE